MKIFRKLLSLFRRRLRTDGWRFIRGMTFEHWPVLELRNRQRFMRFILTPRVGQWGEHRYASLYRVMQN